MNKLGTYFYDLNHESEQLIPSYNESGKLKDTGKIIVDHLMSHIIPIQVGRQEKESTIIDYETLQFDDEYIKKLKERFNRNYGMFVDGKLMRVNDKTLYIKFTTNIAIAMDSGVKIEKDGNRLFSLVSLYERATNHMPTLSVFLNGLKVPDKVIYVYMTDSATDILIPEHYFRYDRDNNRYFDTEVHIQKHVHYLHSYYSKYHPEITGKILEINFADVSRIHLEYDYVLKNGSPTDQIKRCKNILVYNNGRYMNENTYAIQKESNKLLILLGNDFDLGSNVEVLVDSEVRGIHTAVVHENISTGNRVYFTMPEGEMPYSFNFLHGAIPKKNCYFYINNIRISNDKVTQIGRMNFAYKFPGNLLGPYSCTIIYTDKDVIDESKHYIYGEDYYLSNMIGSEHMAKILKDITDGVEVCDEDKPYINPHIFKSENDLDFSEIINKNGRNYSFAYTRKMNRIPEIYSDYETQIRTLIKESGNYLIRDLMNLFSKNDIYAEVFVDDNSPDVFSYTFKTRKDLVANTTKFNYMVDINGLHVNNSKFKINEKYQYNHINIPKTLFRKGYNRIHIREIKYNNGSAESIEYKLIKPNKFTYTEKTITISNEEYKNQIDAITKEIKSIRNNTSIPIKERKEQIEQKKIIIRTIVNSMIGNYKYSYTFDAFRTVIDNEDYTCLERVHNVDGLYYDNELNNGWIIKKDSAFIINDDNTITLWVEKEPTEPIVIYSKRFSFKYHTVLTKDLTRLEDMSLSIKSGDSIGVPIIPSGSFIVFLNGERLYNGIDYVYRHPENYNLIAYSSLCFKRKTKEGDEIEIYFDSVKNATVGRSNDILSHSGTVWNKYGLIYFGNLRFPYSPKYIDLYVNGRYIYPDQIDILSDKLIRIDCDIKNPMYDIFAETSLNTDLDKVRFFFDYKSNPYQDSPFEKVLGALFTEYDFSTLTSPTENAYANSVYESFDIDVDSWKRVPNALRDHDKGKAHDIANKLVPRRYNLYENAYLLWLKSNATKTLIIPSKNVLQHIMNYFKFYIEDFNVGDRQDIIISSQFTKLFNDIHLSIRKYPNSKERTMRLLQFAKGNSIPLQAYKKNDSGFIVLDTDNLSCRNIFNKARDTYKFSNTIYPRDFPKCISSRTRIAQINRDIVLGGKTSSVFSNTTTHK